MTDDESKLLTVGTRVCFNRHENDCGTVTATNARYVTIKWDDGHRSFTGHNAMYRVELFEKRVNPNDRR